MWGEIHGFHFQSKKQAAVAFRGVKLWCWWKCWKTSQDWNFHTVSYVEFVAFDLTQLERERFDSAAGSLAEGSFLSVSPLICFCGWEEGRQESRDERCSRWASFSGCSLIRMFDREAVEGSLSFYMQTRRHSEKSVISLHFWTEKVALGE